MRMIRHARRNPAPSENPLLEASRVDALSAAYWWTADYSEGTSLYRLHVRVGEEYAPDARENSPPFAAAKRLYRRLEASDPTQAKRWVEELLERMEVKANPRRSSKLNLSGYNFR